MKSCHKNVRSNLNRLQHDVCYAIVSRLEHSIPVHIQTQNCNMMENVVCLWHELRKSVCESEQRKVIKCNFSFIMHRFVYDLLLVCPSLDLFDVDEFRMEKISVKSSRKKLVRLRQQQSIFHRSDFPTSTFNIIPPRLNTTPLDESKKKNSARINALKIKEKRNL